MRRSDYQDQEGRRWAVWLPEGVPDHDAHLGIPIGPPSLDALDLPLRVAVRMHNELYARRLFTGQDVRRNPEAIAQAVRAAYKVDTADILNLYLS